MSAGAKQTLQKGLARIPGSGKILWGLGIVSVLEGNTAQAAERLERAVELLPEWPGSYSTLGVFYFQTGQIAKAREVLNRFKGSSAGGLDVNRIEEVLSRAPAKLLPLRNPCPWRPGSSCFSWPYRWLTGPSESDEKPNENAEETLKREVARRNSGAERGHRNWLPP